MTGLRVGYASVNTQLPSAARTLRLANVTPERLRELIAANELAWWEEFAERLAEIGELLRALTDMSRARDTRAA